ncbi:CopG family transcriptional regulator [Halopelagius longus]|uniref:CopG family transcriptional regulator n=1 Tax=Halopelagius longus TaxID=1236180 RepID=A0A1H0YK47_9EURY|nr:CopG family transcriptional regulator [Halopelagius longus]SDQ15579.1 hypothetical protein SAMN05216278_0687 [Halopelagius longus]
MGGEKAESLPDELALWLDEKAEELGTTRNDVVSRAVAAYRLVDENHDSLSDVAAGSDADGPTDGESNGGPDADALAARLEELDAEFDEKLTDVRERVVQVKRETDRKAPADHDHPDLSGRVETLSEEFEAVDDRVAEGFENYEEILEYLTETTDEAESKLDTLASAVVSLRRRADELERSRAERAAGAELKREANRAGVEEASCENCGTTVSLGLLDGPYCPQCTATFDGVEPKRGFLGTATLSTGDRPALQRPEAGERTAEELFDEGA